MTDVKERGTRKRNGMTKITTITGPEAELIIKVVESTSSHQWIDRSRNGVAKVELWVDDNELPDLVLKKEDQRQKRICK